MAVEINSVRKVVELKYDKAKVQGTTISVLVDGVEKKVTANDGLVDIYFASDYSGSCEVEIKGSKAGADTGTVSV